MGVTCNYFIALKIPELLVSVYRARARQGHKLQPLALAPNVQQSRTGPGSLARPAENRKTKVAREGWPLGVCFISFLCNVITRGDITSAFTDFIIH